MGIVDLIINKGLEALGRYYGTYRAIVVGSEVDEQNRLLITVPAMCKKPILAYPHGQDGSLDSGFKWVTPVPGQVVYVQFIQGDLAYPVWSYHGWGKDEIPEELNGPSKIGFKTKSGHLFTLDDDNGDVNFSIVDADNSVISKVYISNGEVEISTIADNLTTKLVLGKELIIDTQADLGINSSKTIKLNQGNIGLPKADILVQEINSLKSEINTLRAALLTSSVKLVALVPEYAGVATWSGTPPMEATTLKQLSNEKVLQ